MRAAILGQELLLLRLLRRLAVVLVALVPVVAVARYVRVRLTRRLVRVAAATAGAAALTEKSHDFLLPTRWWNCCRAGSRSRPPTPRSRRSRSPPSCCPGACRSRLPSPGSPRREGPSTGQPKPPCPSRDRRGRPSLVHPRDLVAPDVVRNFLPHGDVVGRPALVDLDLQNHVGAAVRQADLLALRHQRERRNGAAFERPHRDLRAGPARLDGQEGGRGAHQ